MKLNFGRVASLVGSGALVTLALAGSAFAQIANPIVATNLGGNTLLQTIFQAITFAAVILFVILLVIGGIQYLGSFGNEEATTKARKLILDAIVGLFIVLAAGGIASLVFTQLGITAPAVGGLNSVVR